MRVLTGTGTSPLDLLVEQLWMPSLADGNVRVAVNPAADADWRTCEEYWVVPSAARARLLVPIGPRAATYGSLVNYRSLRRWRPRSIRQAAGQVSRLGLPLSVDRLAVQRRAATSGVPLPLERVAQVLGHDALYASIGVRTGANRKATLQLVDSAGVARGYAKLAWDDSTGSGVRTEAAALESIGGGNDTARAPALLASGELAGRPYLVSAPLPATVAARATDPMPTPQELAVLCPIARRGPARDTAHFEALSGRIDRVLATPALTPALAAAIGDVASRAAKSDVPLPVLERWHGDLTPWNTARDGDGRLWCWDWECSEPDAVAGLDAMHWAFSLQRRQASGIGGGSLRRALTTAGPHLWAAGIARRDWPYVAALYALTVAERAATLAARAGWGQVWIGDRATAAVLTDALALLDGC